MDRRFVITSLIVTWMFCPCQIQTGIGLQRGHAQPDVTIIPGDELPEVTKVAQGEGTTRPGRWAATYNVVPIRNSCLASHPGITS